MAKSQSTTEHPIHLKVAVSREDRNLGPYISYLQNNSNLPLSLNSFVVVILINSGSKEVHDQYLAVRPQGLASDVVIYDATNTRRLVTVAMDTVNGQRVRVDVQATYEDLLKFVETDLVLQYKSMHDLACQEMRAEFLGDTVEDPSDVDLEPVKASLAPPVAVIEDEDLLDEEEEEEEAPEEFDAFEDVGGGNGPLVGESPTDAADNQFSVEEEELEEDDSVPFDIDDSDVDEEYHPGPGQVTVQEETATGDVVEEEDDSVPFDIDDSDIEGDSSEEATIFADDDSLESGIYYLDEACTQTCGEDGNPISSVWVELVDDDPPVEEGVEEEVVEEEIALYQDENTGQLYLDENLTQPCDEEGNPVEIEEESVEEAVNDNLAGDADQDFLASLQAMDIEGLRVQAKSFGVNHRFANKCNSPETLINKILEKAQG